VGSTTSPRLDFAASRPASVWKSGNQLFSKADLLHTRGSLRRQPDLKELVEHAQPSNLLRGFFTGRSHRNGSINPVINNMSVTVSWILQRVMRYLNPFMRLVLAGRAHRIMSGRLMLLSFTGRRTGRSYTTPVSYVRDGSDLLIPAGGAWWKNLTTGSARVRLQGTWQVVTPEVIQEPGAISIVLGRMLAVNPAIAVFTGIRPGPDGGPVAKSLERECRRGFVVVRLHMHRQPDLL
jgi:deazaflavin-dependent oxidoreductase (nitroreductase family)